ncbi:uncharacterized protein V6R79_009282 [Siganus canaliculatus]
MENYTKARTEEQPSVCPFPALRPDTPEIRVKDGSKIRNLLRYALSRVEAAPPPPPPPPEGGAAQEGGVAQEAPTDARRRPLCTQLVFTATGRGVAKAITCAEIVKRRVKGLHQLTRLLFSAVVEVWEPLEPGAGLDPLTVRRNLPAIWILLSREPLDSSQPGYQAPGRYDALWAHSGGKDEGGGVSAPKPPHKRKKGSGGGGGGGGRGRGSGRQTGRSRDAARGQS